MKSTQKSESEWLSKYSNGQQIEQCVPLEMLVEETSNNGSRRTAA
jgi:hypothetical protein